MSHIALECVEIEKWFGAGRRKVFALKDASFSLDFGQMTYVMGPSGSGKSSLIAALSGLQAPDRGQVMVPDGNLWERSPSKITKFRQEYCGFVFQNVGLFPALSALDQIILPLKLVGISSREARKRALEALEWVGLSSQIKSKPNQMSGGEGQRVAIARMLAKQPSLIFCDEPTSALDRENGSIVVQLLRRAAIEKNAMVFCSTHDDRIVHFADRVIEVEDGVLIKDSENPESV